MLAEARNLAPVDSGEEAGIFFSFDSRIARAGGRRTRYPISHYVPQTAPEIEPESQKN
jgi:hypothetical protein